MTETSNVGILGSTNVAEEIKTLTYSTVLTAWPRVIARVWQIQKQVETALKNDTAVEILEMLTSSSEAAVAPLIQSKDAEQVMWQIKREEEERGQNLLMLESIAGKTDKSAELNKLNDLDSISEKDSLSGLDYALFGVRLENNNARMILSAIPAEESLEIRKILCREMENKQYTHQKVYDLSQSSQFQKDWIWIEKLMAHDGALVLEAFMEEGLILNATADSRSDNWHEYFSTKIRVVGFGQSFEHIIKISQASDESTGYQISETPGGNGWENVSDLNHTVIYTLPEPPEDEADFATALADYCTTGKVYVFTCT
jgi:hypothetical protein